MEGIQLSVEKAGVKNSISVIKIGGYIDTTTSSELEHALNSLLKSGSNNIIIDLGNVDYVSSAGWGIFISEIKGIREKGGDLKLVRMIPEVYEVFELLEFHFILKSFDTLDEAILDFERSGIVGSESEVVTMDTGKLGEKTEQTVPNETRTPDIADLSLTEKIKKIVADDPDAGTTQIVRTLKSPQYGNVKVRWFGVRRILKQTGLDNKKKRRETAGSM